MPLVLIIIFSFSLLKTHGGTEWTISPIEQKLPWRFSADQPEILLTRSFFYKADGWGEAIVHLPPTWQDGEKTDLAVTSPEGRLISGSQLHRTKASQTTWMVYFPLAELSAGGKWNLTLKTKTGRINAPFSLHPATRKVVPEVSIRIPAAPKGSIAQWPMKIGIPLERGALYHPEDAYLADETGRRVPVSLEVMERWSRFGSVRWLGLGFTGELKAQPREWTLHLSPRKDGPKSVEEVDDLTTFRRAYLDARSPRQPKTPERTKLSLSEAARFLPESMTPETLRGLSVTDGRGRRFSVPEGTTFEAIRHDAVSTVLEARGWLHSSELQKERFCQFVIRLERLHGSCATRLLLTWIYTGDAYRDPIRHIAWDLPLSKGHSFKGFLRDRTALFPREVNSVQQIDDHQILTRTSAGMDKPTEGRLPGIAVFQSEKGAAAVAVKHFWQNYPQQLTLNEDRLTFHLWPENGVIVRKSPSAAEATRLWFAHQGELLDFSLPDAYLSDAYTQDIPTSRRSDPGYTYAKDKHLQANAQGVSKTTEVWLVDAPQSTPERAGDLAYALISNELMATVSPGVIAASGVFGPFGAPGNPRFTAWEELYQRHYTIPAAWMDRLHLYGKWIWGDMAWQPDFEERTHANYRSFRKTHQGWPYSWLPYLWSGEPLTYTLAEAASRKQADISYVHYSDERVGKRPLGWYTRSNLPWGHNRNTPTNRSREDKADFLYNSYSIARDPRALDVASDFAWRTIRHPVGLSRLPDQIFSTDMSVGPWNRTGVTLLDTYLRFYEATADPWFIAASHQIAREQIRAFREKNWPGMYYNPGPLHFALYTSNQDYREFYLAYASRHALQQNAFSTYHPESYPHLEPLIGGYLLSGEARFRNAIAGQLERARLFSLKSEVPYLNGFYGGYPVNSSALMYTGYFLKEFPAALAILETGEALPSPPGFWVADPAPKSQEGQTFYTFPAVYFQKGTSPLRLSFRVSGPANQWHYSIRNATGKEVRQGRWRSHTPKAMDFVEPPLFVILEDDLPGGTYQVIVSGYSKVPPGDPTKNRLHALYLPLTPPGTPEVVALPDTGIIGPSFWQSQFWFHYRPGKSELSLKNSGSFYRQAVIEEDSARRSRQRIELTGNELTSVGLSASETDRFVRIATGGNNREVQVSLGALTAPFWSLEKERWFNPLSSRD